MQVAQNVPTSLKQLQQNYFFKLVSFFRRGVIKELSEKVELRHFNYANWKTIVDTEAKLHFAYTSKNMTDNATGKN